MQFSSLKLSGFKSFVESTEVPIDDGLTGIVGPNGCGKSNLVEALRWVMGETSARQIRGDEMDDVIFKGTTSRPTRNLAEVAVVLDNHDRKATGAFNDADELEVSRRIERGQGSNYRINGRDVRARDVQLLFADAATGAHSAAMVSQGRISQLVNAKPIDRRVILEEAAGIAGLHSRRHEAELRLRAAETNLARLEDVLIALDGQLHGLKRQARQATRYRNIGDQLRKIEAQLAFHRWQAAVAAEHAAAAGLAEANRRVAETTQFAAAAATAQADAAAVLPPKRQSEAAAAEALAAARRGEAELAAEERRVTDARREVETRLAEIAADLTRESALADDARSALAQLDDARTAIAREQAGEAEAIARAETLLAAAQERNDVAETALADIHQRIAADEARKTSLERQIVDLKSRVQRISQESDAVAAERMPLAAESSAEAEIAGAAAATAKAEADLAARRASVERAEIDRARALDEDAARADTLRAAETAVARCGAESAALRELLSTERIGDLPPIVDSIDADPGFETALGAALGDDLSAPLSDDAPLRWRSLPPLASSWPLPGGVVTLARHVRAPEALTRRLSQIGLAADAAEGARLQPILLPGQRLVTRDGGLWRWDGYSVASGTPTAAAVRLKQRNRLTELESERMSAESGRTEAAQRRDAARVAAEAAIRLDREAREAVARALDRLAEAKMVQSVLSQRLAAMASRLSALSERADRLKDDRMEAEEHLLAAETILVAIGDLSDALAEAAHRRAEVADGRVGLIAARAERDRLVSAQDERRRRLTQIDADRRSWHDRSEGAVRRIAALTERRRQAQSDLERLSTRPAELAALRAEALDSIQGAEAARNIAGDALAAAEAALADADRRLRNAERDLAESRESRVRSEAAAAQAEEAKRRLAEEIRARLEIPPERVLELADLDPEQAPSAPEELAHKHERLVREREAIGPVNLRAEDEMRELDQQIEGLKNERNDLVQAISRLRHGIYELNREGRERLLASFDKVNDHFSSLFTRLFGGGKAFLKLTDSDDPLEAGLEIMASPPGTRMQILSLLSGGETTLTALALLFAVFLTNPAPICVLDEADAALDDANVDRFCTLLDDIVKETGTRFIVITHHRMTMARMDRLYGVTMAERGVSQLVTVDLRQAEAIAGAA